MKSQRLNYENKYVDKYPMIIIIILFFCAFIMKILDGPNSTKTAKNYV